MVDGLISRRGITAGLAALTASIALPAMGQGAYPTKPVRLIVPFAAGGTTDIFARLIGAKLSESLGQQFVVENRGGAGGGVGTDAVAKSAPDGYTLVMGTVGTHAINVSLYPSLPYDPVRDFVPVAFAGGVPNVLVVNPRNVKATTVPAFIAEAKASARKFTMASSGAGTSIHLSGELFKQLTGVDLVHVPYRGSGPAVTDLVGGQVDVMFDNLPSSIEQVRGGNLRAIAVTSEKPSAALPGVPTIAAEANLPGFDASSWFAIYAPANTPRAIVDKLNAEVRRAVADPEIARRISEIGGEARAYSPEDLGAFTRSEIEKWAKVVKASGAKVE